MGRSRWLDWTPSDHLPDQSNGALFQGGAPASGGGTATAQNPQTQCADNLRDSISMWLSDQCAVIAVAASNPRILHREFVRWSGVQCSEEAFIAELERSGFGLDAYGMICGLLWGVDFVAACVYERSNWA